MTRNTPHALPNAQRTPWAYLGVGLLVLLTLVALTEVNYRFALANPGGNDFLARWMGAHMWLKEGLSPYNERVSLASQVAIYGRPADAGRGEDIRTSSIRFSRCSSSPPSACSITPWPGRCG